MRFDRAPPLRGALLRAISQSKTWKNDAVLRNWLTHGLNHNTRHEQSSEPSTRSGPSQTMDHARPESWPRYVDPDRQAHADRDGRRRRF